MHAATLPASASCSSDTDKDNKSRKSRKGGDKGDKALVPPVALPPAAMLSQQQHPEKAPEPSVRVAPAHGAVSAVDKTTVADLVAEGRKQTSRGPDSPTTDKDSADKDKDDSAHGTFRCCQLDAVQLAAALCSCVHVIFFRLCTPVILMFL